MFTVFLLISIALLAIVLPVTLFNAVTAPGSGRLSPVTISATTGNTTSIRPFHGGIYQRYVGLANIRNERTLFNLVSRALPVP